MGQPRGTLLAMLCPLEEQKEWLNDTSGVEKLLVPEPETKAKPGKGAVEGAAEGPRRTSGGSLSKIWMWTAGRRCKRDC